MVSSSFTLNLSSGPNFFILINLNILLYANYPFHLADPSSIVEYPRENIVTTDHLNADSDNGDSICETHSNLYHEIIPSVNNAVIGSDYSISPHALPFSAYDHRSDIISNHSAITPSINSQHSESVHHNFTCNSYVSNCNLTNWANDIPIDPALNAQPSLETNLSCSPHLDQIYENSICGSSNSSSPSSSEVETDDGDGDGDGDDDDDDDDDGSDEDEDVDGDEGDDNYSTDNSWPNHDSTQAGKLIWDIAEEIAADVSRQESQNSHTTLSTTTSADLVHDTHWASSNRTASSRGRTSGRRGPHKTADPGNTFKSLQTAATTALLDGQLDVALRYAREAVKQNPEIYPAHSLLSEILYAMHREDESLAVLLSGAQSSRDVAVWWHIVERVRNSSTDDAKKRENLLYCYSSLVRLTPDDTMARLEKIRVSHELGKSGRGLLKDCVMLLKQQPCNFVALYYLGELALNAGQTDDMQAAVCWFDYAINAVLSGNHANEGELDFDFLIMYVDLLTEIKFYRKAIFRLRCIARWLVGRSDEVCWHKAAGQYLDELGNVKSGKSDNVNDYATTSSIITDQGEVDNWFELVEHDDDREWDENNHPRRILQQGFVQDGYPIEFYAKALPLQLRAKLGILRIKLGEAHYAEGLMHLSKVLANLDSVSEGIVIECTTVLIEKRMYEAAFKFLRDWKWGLGERGEYWVAKGICYRELGDIEQSEQCHVENMLSACESVDQREAETRYWQRLRWITEQYWREQKNSGDGISAWERTVATTNGGCLGGPSGGIGRWRMMRRTSVDELWTKLDNLRNGGGQDYQSMMWMETAHDLVNVFRGCHLFWRTRDRSSRFVGYSAAYLEAQGKQVEVEMMDGDGDGLKNFTGLSLVHRDYYGVKFEDWGHIFCEFSVELLKRGLTDAAKSIIEKALEANVFRQDDKILRQVYITIMAMGLALQDSKTLVKACRWFIKQYSYTIDVYRLMSIVHRLIVYTGNSREEEQNNKGNTDNFIRFSSGATQKFVLRCVKSMDYNVSIKRITRHDTNLLSLYGHMLSDGKQYGALHYYFRVLRDKPRDSVLLLSISTIYLYIALQKRSENRHMDILHSAYFLQLYMDSRLGRYNDNGDHDRLGGLGLVIENDGSCQDYDKNEGVGGLILQEVSFNIGRFWHSLGLLDLAQRNYENCLRLNGRISREYDINPMEDVDPTFTAINRSSALCIPMLHGPDLVVTSSQDWQSSRENFTREAAFALRIIYSQVGNFDAAWQLARAFLVI